MFNMKIELLKKNKNMNLTYS